LTGKLLARGGSNTKLFMAFLITESRPIRTASIQTLQSGFFSRD
jgi:hypothetical protein